MRFISKLSCPVGCCLSSNTFVGSPKGSPTGLSNSTTAIGSLETSWTRTISCKAMLLPRKRRSAPKFGDTLSMLIKNFEDSADFEGLIAETKDAYTGWKFKALDKEWGKCPVEVFNDKDESEKFAADAL